MVPMIGIADAHHSRFVLVVQSGDRESAGESDEDVDVKGMFDFGTVRSPSVGVDSDMDVDGGDDDDEGDVRAAIDKATILEDDEVKSTLGDGTVMPDMMTLDV